MLVKNENEWCWCIGENVGYPQKSIEDAVNEFAKTYPADEVPVIVKNYSRIMSVSYILQNCCG